VGEATLCLALSSGKPRSPLGVHASIGLPPPAPRGVRSFFGSSSVAAKVGLPSSGSGFAPTWENEGLAPELVPLRPVGRIVLDGRLRRQAAAGPHVLGLGHAAPLSSRGLLGSGLVCSLPLSRSPCSSGPLHSLAPTIWLNGTFTATP
jgi:hypothetical protein